MIIHLLSFLDHSALLTVLLWTGVGYLLGSIPFSLLLSQWLAGTDIRRIGDGNPGAYNAWQAGGWPVGVLAILCDVGKGLLALLMAQQLGGLSQWLLVPVALAPILGHAFSPFLHFHKAKAVATTLGVWLGLSGLPGIIAFAIGAFVAMGLQEEHAWVVIAGMCSILVFSIFIAGQLSWVAAAVLNLLLLLYTHRAELHQPVHLHNRVGELLLRRRSS
jgi:glycerol-3-phosphate acyltransferase PlsY